MICTGRVCGMSASSAPSETTSSTPSSRAAAITVAEKPFQRRFGSAPDRNTTSRPAPSGEALSITSSGHSISRVRPSLIRTVGRVTWKS